MGWNLISSLRPCPKASGGSDGLGISVFTWKLLAGRSSFATQKCVTRYFSISWALTDKYEWGGVELGQGFPEWTELGQDSGLDPLGMQRPNEVIYQSLVTGDRKRDVEGKSVSVRVDIGGRSRIKQKENKEERNR